MATYTVTEECKPRPSVELSDKELAAVLKEHYRLFGTDSVRFERPDRFVNPTRFVLVTPTSDRDVTVETAYTRQDAEMPDYEWRPVR